MFIWIEDPSARNVIPERGEIPLERFYMLILKPLARSGELHGYKIASSIQATSQDVLQVEEGSLYPLAAADADQGLGYGGVGRHERQSTKLGRKQLATEVLQFDRVIGAIQRVLKPAEER